MCARTHSSLFLLATDAVRRPLPSVRIPSAIRGVTASFGWVRAKETDENRGGDARDEVERKGQGGRGEEEFVKSLPRSLHPVISRQLAPPYSYYGSYSCAAAQSFKSSFKYFALIDLDRRADHKLIAPTFESKIGSDKSF